MATTHPSLGFIALCSFLIALVLAIGVPLAAAWTEDFDAYPIEGQPSGWYDTSIGVPAPEAPGLFMVWADPLDSAGRVFGTHSSSGLPGRGGDGHPSPRSGIFSHYRPIVFDRGVRFLYSGRLWREKSDGYMGVTFFSAYPSEDRYYLLGLADAAAAGGRGKPRGAGVLTFALSAYGTGPLTGAVQSDLSPAPGVWYRFAVRVIPENAGLRVQAKVWPDGEAEPDAWLLEAVDASVQAPVSGCVGLWSAHMGKKYWDDLRAETVIDEEPPVIAIAVDGAPLTNGACFNGPVAPIITLQDQGAATYAAELDGRPYTPGTPVTTEGPHTLMVEAWDEYDNAASLTVNFVCDFTPPALTTLSPPAGTCLAAGPLTLQGTCPEGVAITANGIAATPDAGGAFQIAGLPLAEGTNAVALSTADACGNSAALSLMYTLDTFPPVVAITEPPSGLVTAQETITLEGTITEANLVSLRLNGAAISTVGGTFSIADQPLNPGPTAFSVTATDCAGNSGQAAVTVMRDIEDPVITVREGSSGEAQIVVDPPYDHPVIPLIEVRDDTATTVNAILDGQPFVSGTAVTVQGPHQLHVTATDQAGRQAVLSVSFSIDTAPPAVAILSPSPAEIRASAAFALAIEAGDAERVWANDVQAVPGGGQFTAAMTLAVEGDNPVHIEAYDRAGNRGVLDVVYVLDSLPPHIVIRTPAPGFLLSQPVVDVAGSIEDEPHPAGVSVNDLPAIVSGTGFARAAVPLVEGSAVVTVIAVDTLGHQSTATVEGIVDLTPPQAYLLANGEPLTEGAFFNAPVALTAQVSDALTGATAAYQVNSQPYAEGTFLAGEGIYQVRLTAADGAGNTAVIDRTFTIDKTPPALSGIRPAVGSCTAAATVTLSGRCDDAVSVTVNGTAAQVEGGSFACSPILQEGNNAFALRAADAAGNVSAYNHTLILDTCVPVLNIAAPADGALTTASSVIVTGTVSDSHLMRVLVNGAEAPLSANAFQSLPTALPEGETLITVEAFDCAENASPAKSVKVVRDTLGPVLAITSPRPNETSGSASLTVRGTVADDHLKEVIVGATTAALAEGTYAAAVTLQPGANTLRVTASDTLGNQTVREVVVAYDVLAPSIAITSPAANAVLTTPAITVTGIVADDHLMENGVTINGQTAVVADGVFTKMDLDLAEGSNTLIARATDTFDHSATATITVTRDTTPPTVTSTQPADQAAGVPLDCLLKVTFSEILDWATVTPQSFVLIPAVAGTFSHSGAVLTFRPSSSLPPDTGFTARITAEIKDKAGLALVPHAFTFSTLDSLAPMPPVLISPASPVCQNPITVAGSAEPGARIVLTGGQSAVMGGADASGNFSLQVRLKEGTLNLLEARARDAAGNTSAPAAAEVIHSCAAPEVTEALLDSAAAVIRVAFSKPMDASTLAIAQPPTIDPASNCVVLDSAGSPLAVTGSWDAAGEVLSLALPDPGLAQAVLTLRITAGIKDRLGIPLAYPFMKMFNTAYDAFLSGVIFDDTTGLPLPGAVVTPGGYGASGPSTASNGEGKYTLAMPQTPVGNSELLLFAKEGATPIWRRDAAISRRETIIFDARLTPRSAAFTIPLAGVADYALNSGTTLTVAAGAFAAPVEAQITLLSSQGLPNLLPLGWSPLIGLEVLLSAEPVSGGVLTVTRREAEPLDVAHLYLAVYSVADHQWRAVAEIPLSDPAAPAAALPGTGFYAFVYPDSGVAGPGDVTLGAPLPGAASPAEPLAFTADMELAPPTVLPTQTALCAVTNVVEAHGLPIPSGYPVTARVQEALTLIGGSTLAVPPYAASLLLFKSPVTDAGGAFPPALIFPVTPSLMAREVVLDVGYDHVSLFPFPTEVRRGDSIGPAGGSFTGSDGLTLTVPAGATDDYVPVSLESVPESALSIPLPAGLRFLAAAQVSFGTFELTKTALLSAPFPEPLGEKEFPVLLTLDQQMDGTYAVFHATAEQISGTLESCEIYPSTVLSDPPVRLYTPCSGTHDPNDLPLPALGVRRSGIYIFAAFQVAPELNPGLHLLAGRVEDRTVPPLSDAYPLLPDQFIRSLASPLHALTDENGEYSLVVPLRDALLSTVKRSTGDTVQNTVEVLKSQPWIYTGVDLAIQSVPPTIATWSPSDHAPNIPLTPVIEISFSEPLAPSSVGADAVVLRMDGFVMEGIVALSSSGLQLTFRPASSLLEGTAYTYTVSGALKDLAGNALAGINPPITFTTMDLILPADVDRTRIRLLYDEQTGKADVVGAAGAVPADALVTVEHITVASGTRSYAASAGVDGSFTFHAGGVAPFPCALQDRIILHVMREGAGAITLELSPFEMSDGRGAWLDDRAAAFTTGDGITVSVEAGTFGRIVPVTVDTVSPMELDYKPAAGFNAQAAVRVDLDGAPPAKPLHLAFPLAAAPAEGETLWLAGLVPFQGRQWPMITAPMRVEPNAEGLQATSRPAVPAGLRISSAADCYAPEVFQAGIYMLFNSMQPLTTVAVQLTGDGTALVADPPGTIYLVLSSTAPGYEACLVVPRDAPFQIGVYEASTGVPYATYSYDPPDAPYFEIPDPLYTQTGFPYPAGGYPVRFHPFTVVEAGALQEFGLTANHQTNGDGIWDLTLTLARSLETDESLTIGVLKSGAPDAVAFLGPECGESCQWRFTGLHEDDPLLLAHVTRRLDPRQAFILQFPSSKAVLPTIGAFRFNGATPPAFIPAPKEDPVPRTELEFTPAEALQYGDTDHPDKDPIHTLTLVKGGLRSLAAPEPFPVNFSIKFRATSPYQGNRSPVGGIIRDMVHIGAYLVISVEGPLYTGVGTELVAETASAQYYLAVYDASNPEALLYISHVGTSTPFNALRLDPHGRIIGVRGKVGQAASIAAYRLESGQLVFKGGHLLGNADSQAGLVPMPYDLSLYSDDAVYEVASFDPSSPSEGLPPTYTLTETTSGRYTLSGPPVLHPVTLVSAGKGLRWTVDSGTVSLADLSIAKGDRLRLLVNRNLMAYAAVNDRGVIAVDVHDFYGDADDPAITAIFAGEQFDLCDWTYKTPFAEVDSVLAFVWGGRLRIAAGVSVFGIGFLLGNPDGTLSEDPQLGKLLPKEQIFDCPGVEAGGTPVSVEVSAPVVIPASGNCEKEHDYLAFTLRGSNIELVIYDLQQWSGRSEYQPVDPVIRLTNLPATISRLVYDSSREALYGRTTDGRVAVFDMSRRCEGVVAPPAIYPGTAGEGLASLPPFIFPELGIGFAALHGAGIAPVAFTAPVLRAVGVGMSDPAAFVVPLGVKPKPPEKQGDPPQADAFTATLISPYADGQTVTVRGASALGSSGSAEWGPGFPVTEQSASLARISVDKAQDAYFWYRSADPFVPIADPRAQRLYEADYNTCKNDPAKHCAAPPGAETGKEFASGKWIGLGLGASARVPMTESGQPIAWVESVRPEMVDSPRPEPPMGAAVADLGVESVFLNSGEYATAATDLAVRGRGLDFAFVRTYSSQSIQHGPLGRGWDHAYNQRLRFLPSGGVEYYDGAGHQYLFYADPNSELQTAAYIPPSGVFLELQRGFNGKQWCIRDPQNNLLLFNETGRLTQIWDRNADGEGAGNRITLTYDIRERLIAVKDDLGRPYRFEYYPDTAEPGADGGYPGLLHTVTDFDGRTVTYAYNQNANLVEVTGPSAEVCDEGGGCAENPVLLARYTYEELTGNTATLLNRTSNLLSLQNGNGETVMENTSIGGAGDQVLAQRVGGAAYALDGLMGVTEAGDGEVTVTVQRDDASALTTRYVLENKRIKELYEPGMAQPTAFTHNADGLLASVTKPEGNLIRFSYAGDSLRADIPLLSRANLLSVTEIPKPQSGETAITTTFAYDKNDLIESRVESAGVPFRWTGIERDARGNPIAVTECAPAGGTSCKPGEPNASTALMAWDDFGRLTAHTDSGGRTTTYQYDGRVAGYLSQKTEQEGGNAYITDYATDLRGNVTEIDPAKAGDYPSIYEYDTLDRVQSELRTDSGGQSLFRSETRYDYDGAGNLLARETYGGLTEAGEIWSRTTMTYDPLGSMLTRTQQYREDGAAKAGRTLYRYDGLQNLTRIDMEATGGDGCLVPVGPVTTYAYDSRNLLSDQTVSNRDAQNPVVLHWGYGYTDNGLRSTVTNPRGKIYSTHYDGLDRVKYTLDPSGVKNESTLASDGTLTDSKTWQGSDLLAWTHYAYNDPLKRLTDTCQKLFTYPYAAPQATEVCTHTDYYPDGKVRYEIDPLGLRTENLYTQRGLTDKVIQAVSDGQGGYAPVVQTAYEYDANGIKTAEVVTEYDQGAPVGSYRTEYAYDKFGRLETVADPLGHQTRYAYDARGNKVRETDPEGSFIQFQYDDLGRMTKKTEQTGGETDFTYTPLGQTETITDANGHVTKYEYDDLNRPTKTYYAYGTPEQVIWENEYDAYGNLWRVHDPNGNVIESAYDDRERLIGRSVIASAPGLVGPITESYAYDALSRMTTASNPEVSVAFTYDSLGRKLTEASTIAELGQAFTITKGYDPAGNRTKTLYPSARDIRRDYDRLGRLRHVTDYTSGLRQLAQYDYIGLQPDRILYGTSQVPVVSTAFAYDPERKLLSQHTTNPNIQTPASSFGLPASGLDYGWTTGDRRRFRARPQQNGLGNVFKYDRMSRVVEERIGVPGAALAGHNVPNAAPLEVAPAAGLLSYAMDPVYNFTSVTEYQNGLNDRRQYTTNARNQVTQAGNVMVEWDANGNMISKSNGYILKYDFNNRLREATNPGGLNITYAYDPFNRRVLKKTQATGYGLQSTVFVWDDQEVVEEYTKADAGSLQISKQYVPAQQIDQKISANADLNGEGALETEYFFLQDQLGNVEAIVDGQGNKLEEYEYRGYGTTRIYAPDTTLPQVEQVRTLADGKLLVLFTEPLYPDSVTSTTVQILDSNQIPVLSVQSLSSDKRLLTIEGTFREGANYTVKVDGVRDLALNPLVYTLPSAAFRLGTVLYDTKAPEIERIWQSEGNVFVSFTEDLMPASVAADAVQIVRNALPATGTATLADARTIQFIPDHALIPDASYVLSIAPAVTDLTLQPSAFQPIAFDYTPLAIAFYTRGDQRQERSTSAYKNFQLFQGRAQDVETGLFYFRNRWLDSSLRIWTTEDPYEYSNGINNLYQGLDGDYENNADPRGAWVADMHFYASFYLAIKAGYSYLNAYTIANSNQFVDDWDETNPDPFTSLRIVYARNTQILHFPTPRNNLVDPTTNYVRNATNKVLTHRSLELIGISLHILGDSYAHRGYRTPMGHGPSNLLFHKFHPLFADEAYQPKRIQDAIETCRQWYDYLRQYNGYKSGIGFGEVLNEIYPVLTIEGDAKKLELEWRKVIKKNLKDSLLQGLVPLYSGIGNAEKERWIRSLKFYEYILRQELPEWE